MTADTDTATIIPEGDDLARQTAQAKILREARDQLAARARALAEAKNHKGLERMGLPANSRDRINKPDRNRPEKQAAHLVNEILDGADFSTADLAEVLGVSLPALRNWMAPEDNKVHREMPQTAKLLLARILADKPKR